MVAIGRRRVDPEHLLGGGLFTLRVLSIKILANQNAQNAPAFLKCAPAHLFPRGAGKALRRPGDEVDVALRGRVRPAAAAPPLSDIAWIRVALGKGWLRGRAIESLHLGDGLGDLLDEFISGHDTINPGLSCRPVISRRPAFCLVAAMAADCTARGFSTTTRTVSFSKNSFAPGTVMLITVGAADEGVPLPMRSRARPLALDWNRLPPCWSSETGRTVAGSPEVLWPVDSA